MQFTNINIQSLVLFIAISLSFSVLLYLFFIKREKLKKKYFLLFNQSKHCYIKYIFLFISLFIILFGLFNIKYGEKSGVNEINGVDIVFVLDVSKSMNALDFKQGKYNISRLDFSKAIISKYIENNSENRYGLVIFAGEAISSSPLTTDHSTFLTFLDNVDYMNLNKQGTNLERAVELGVERLISLEEDDRAKAMILISDGGDEDEQVDFDYIGEIVDGKNITTFILGVGKESGTKIPTGQDFMGNILYQKYMGEDVITKLNTSIISELSSSLNGSYFIADNIDSFEKIESKLENLEKQTIEVAGIKNKIDFGRALAILSLIFFILYLFFNAKRNEK